MTELYYVTTNQGKLEEVSAFMQKHRPDIVIKSFAADILEIQSLDQQEVAIDKALKAWRLLKKPLLVDDAGMYFEKYHEFPGVMSKFISAALGMAGLLKLVEDGDKAFFRLVMVYVDAEGKAYPFDGHCAGFIMHPKEFVAHKDLPYDDIFVPEELPVNERCSYSVLRQDLQKFAPYSYRLRALRSFLNWYNHK